MFEPTQVGNISNKLGISRKKLRNIYTSCEIFPASWEIFPTSWDIFSQVGKYFQHKLGISQKSWEYLEKVGKYFQQVKKY